MKIHHINLNTKVKNQLFHLAVGNFDGVHLGHNKIISSLIIKAKNENKPSAILSFHPHPRQFFSKTLDCYKIISEEKKQNLLSDLGIDYYFCLKFDKSVSELSPSEFIINVLVNQLKVNKLVVGYDFRFGKNREGDIKLLEDYSKIHGFLLEVINPIKSDKSKEIYSSTSIRDFIKHGKMEEAKMMLGRSWTMEGEVIHGDKRASKMNFPTANILPHQEIYPLKGVYAVSVILNNNKFAGIANFGERPTIEGNKLLLEVHLFDFNKDIYGNYLTVEFLTFIRKEKKFNSFDILAEQIKNDIQVAREYHLKK